MKPYYDLLKDVLENGSPSDDRTGVGTLSKFGGQIKFDLKKGFPLLTGKYTHFNSIKAELLWFLSGSTDNEDLRKLNEKDSPTIWEEWQLDGDLGPIYSQQWRCWWGDYNCSVDQINGLIDGLMTRPTSRRHVVSAWNVADLPNESMSPQENVYDGRMALAPCHVLFQMGVRKLSDTERVNLANANPNWRVYLNFNNFDGVVPKYELSCSLYQRSADLFLGLPFNIASYALLTHMLAQVTNMTVGELTISLGDYHIYKNHIDQVKELLSRNTDGIPIPSLVLNKNVKCIDDFKMTDIGVENYHYLPAIKAQVAI